MKLQMGDFDMFTIALKAPMAVFTPPPVVYKRESVSGGLIYGTTREYGGGGWRSVTLLLLSLILTIFLSLGSHPRLDPEGFLPAKRLMGERYRGDSKAVCGSGF